jgi:isoleucyl-tRNA synthetase
VALDLRFGFNLGEAAGRKLCALWNIYVFFVTYALVDKPDLTAEVPPGSRHVTDRWLLARTQSMLAAATKAYENYAAHSVVREVDEYLEDVSNWYVRINRRRFWRSGAAADKAACYQALHHCLQTTVEVLAPIVPFITEEIWQNAVRPLRPEAPESVHHADWPQAPEAWSDPALLERTALARQAISLALHLREKANIRVRQPLRAVLVKGPETAVTALQEHMAIVQSELNIKEVRFISDTEALYVPRLAVNLRAAGPILRGDMQKVKELMDSAPAPAMAVMVAEFDSGRPVRVPGYANEVAAAAFTRERGMAPGLQVAEEGELTIALDTVIDEALELEGLSRDLVRNLQVLRKDAGLEVTQRVELSLATKSAKLLRTISEHRGYITAELLAVELHDRAMDKAAASKDLDICGHQVTAALRPSAQQAATA